MLTVCMAIAVSCLCIVGVGFAADEDPTLEFGMSERLYKTLRLSDLRPSWPLSNWISWTLSTVSRNAMTPLSSRMSWISAFGDQWRLGDWTEVVFTALDGYQAVTGRDHMLQPGGFLTFKDLDVEAGWEPIGRRKANPGPFYLVWTGVEQTTQHEFPWPWQVVRISILRSRSAFRWYIPQALRRTRLRSRAFSSSRDAACVVTR